MDKTEDGGPAFTPGDWYIYRGEDGEALAVAQFVDGDNGGTVAKTIAKMPVPINWGPKNARTTREEINANALVLVAAPSLLAALEAALATVQEPTGLGIGNQGLEFRFPTWVQAARAAILLARGAA